MRIRITLIVVFLCAICLGAGAGYLLRKSPSGSDSADTFPDQRDQLIDLGDVAPAQDVETVCVLVNDTAQVLENPTIFTTCGCVVPRLPKRPLNPGESMELPIVFTAPYATMATEGEQRISVVYQKADPTVYEYVLRYQILPAFVVTPEKIDFGTLGDTQPSSRTLSLKFPASIITDQVSVKASSSFVSVGKPKFNADATACEVELVCIRPTQSPSEYISGAIVVRRTDIGASTSVPYKGRIRHPLVVNPVDVMPGFIPIGTNQYVTIFITTTHNAPLTMDRRDWILEDSATVISCSIKSVTISSSQGSCRAAVRIAYKTTAGGVYSGTFKISHTLSGIRVAVPYSFFARCL